jgi:hypothetical protein
VVADDVSWLNIDWIEPRVERDWLEDFDSSLDLVAMFFNAARDLCWESCHANRQYVPPIVKGHGRVEEAITKGIRV